MLSTENPPPDPPCSSDQIPQLKSISDERVSDDNINQVDLLKSGLDDNHPLPKFSIRDYVFNTRGKDIKNHWPFSPKNLQLCLKHGIKDVLPPFQTLESVRNPPTVKSAAENISNSVAKSDHLSSNDAGQELALNIENNKSSGSEEDKECPSTTTSLSCSDVNSVRQIKTTNLKPEAENLVEKAEFAVPASNKVENNTENTVKKCKLIVKLSNIGEPKSNEELSVVSETMASKVCPVCKTFTSSSNTTLNAHIDQCLSSESTNKGAANSKVIKHRIKPRKTRLMVDIYATAQCCTLEDLDRRNGTNWASNLAFAVLDMEECAEEKNNRLSSANSEDKADEGAVYFDSNGTKLRILSKFSDLQSNANANDDFGSTKLVKRDKGSKLLSSKKKKVLVRSHKLQPDHSPEVNNGQEREFPPDEDEKEDSAQPSKPIDETKSNDFGMIKTWVGSKRTGLKKKNMERESRHPDKIIKNVRVKCSMPSLGDKFVKRASDTGFTMLSDDPLISTESLKRKEDSTYSSHDEYMEQPCLGKKAGFSSLQSRDGKKDHLVISQCNVKHSNKEGLSVHKRCINLPNGTENYVSSRTNKKMRSVSPTVHAVDAGSSFFSSRMSRHHRFSSGGKELRSLKKASLDHATLSGGKKLPSLRKNLLPARHASFSESKKSLERKHLEFKKPRQYCMSGSDEEAGDGSEIPRQDNRVEMLDENACQMEKAYGKSLKDKATVLKIRKKNGVFVNTGKEGDMASKRSNASPKSDSDGVEKNIDAYTGGNASAGTSNIIDAVKQVEIRDEFVCEPTPKISGGEAFMAFGEPLESLAGPSDAELISERYIKSYEEHQSEHQALGGDEQEVFCADKVGEDLVTSNAHMVEEINANEGNGDYFVDVDPIPIPGPPGSFLPSPGRMGSEELQGNSSLTTCRVHPSEDEHELIDMDSSDSPISATSFVSNPILLPHESQRDISEDRMDPIVESHVPLEQASPAYGKTHLDESRANSVSPEMSPDRFKNSQPCCCSRKEGVLQSGSLNYPESQLLKRRTMTSLPQDKQMGRDPNDKLYSFNFPEKAPTPEPKIVGANSLKRKTEPNFPTSGDCESPSTSKPILRLMGKNLMVMNKEGYLTPQSRLSPSSTVNDHPRLHSAADKTVSGGNIHCEHCSFDHTLSRGSQVFENVQMVQHVDMSSSDGSRIRANFGAPELSVHPSGVMLSSKSFGGSFSTSLEGREFNFDQLGSQITMQTPNGYQVDKVRTPDPSRGKHKEIIVIDDSPENEPSSAVKASTALGYDPRHVNPFHTYQTRCYPLYSGSQMVRNTNTQVPPSMITNENLVKWNRTPEGSRLLHPNSLTASSPSTGHLRSTFYFSPGYSLPANFTR
ncbi:hypothetical protein CDL12_15526 [Handroanthus impetiginosus]|uniref:Uncharacterized protein n=1 Tax=Handroanthus impetiginosus TaxID=429701 RepID=A0A2G9H2W4_9LAMI|nr:hypothetical protein CDL12_15526 [Handroanthus impetiginosus]